MTSPKHIYIAVGAVVLALAGHAYVSSRGNTIRAQQVRDDVAQQITGLRTDLSTELAKIKADKKQVKTSAQIVQRLPQYIPLPKPIFLQPPETVPTHPTHSVLAGLLPDAPSASQGSALVIPAESVTAFWEHETSCKEDALKLGECRQELPLIKKRAVAAEKAMKGGGFWTRLKANSKWLVFGAASGVAAACATGHCK